MLDGKLETLSTWNSSAFRGILSDGGGTASILVVDGHEAVVLTVSHGMISNNPKDYGWSAGPHDPSGGANPGSVPFTENVTDFEKYWTFDDPHNCKAFNLMGFKFSKTKLQCRGIAMSGGCDGADFALYRMNITREAQAVVWPTVKLAFDALPVANGTHYDTGYGCVKACSTDGAGAGVGDDACSCTLNSGQTMVSNLRSSQINEWGTSQQAWLPEGITIDCAGDSGGPVLAAGWSPAKAPSAPMGAVGLNSQGDDLDPHCKKGEQAVCAWKTATSNLNYAQRVWARKLLTSWKPAWGELAQYKCEPVAAAGGSCAAGCKACPGLEEDLSLEAPFGECYPRGAMCPVPVHEQGFCCVDDDGGPAPCAGDACLAEQMVPDPVPRAMLCQQVKDKEGFPCRRWDVSTENNQEQGGVEHQCVAKAGGACPVTFRDCSKAKPTSMRSRAPPGPDAGNTNYLKYHDRSMPPMWKERKRRLREQASH